jgi:MFS-type transporter involved in bile tolerance (Atg22 family)
MDFVESHSSNLAVEANTAIPDWIFVSQFAYGQKGGSLTLICSILGDSLNTTVTVIATLQNEVVAYNTLTLTYLYIVGIAAQLVGIGGFWLIQKKFKLSTKVMFDIIIMGILVLDGWGMIGSKHSRHVFCGFTNNVTVWTQKFGFHNGWEFYLYQVYYGLFVCPWYAYSFTMVSEVTPRGKEFLFFSL